MRTGIFDSVNKSKFISKTKEEKELIKIKVLNYTKEQLSKGKFVTKRDIQKKFEIDLYSYFNTLRDIYQGVGFDVVKYPGFRRRENEKTIIRERMIKYVKDCLINNKKPTVGDIRREFRSGIQPYFENVTQLYKKAGVDLVNFFSFFYKEKEIKLTPIIEVFIRDKGYTIKRVAIKENGFGPDIIVEKDGMIIPVEIKARHKNNTLLYPNDDPIKQIKNYIDELNSPFGILITTADKLGKKKLPKNIILYKGEDLIRHFEDNNGFLQIISWVREAVGQEKRDFIKENKEKIIHFIRKEYNNGRLPTHCDIVNSLKLRFYCYFNSMFEAYEESGIQYPLDRKKKSGRLSQEERKVIKENLCQFARKQYYSNGRLNSNEIEKRFHIDIRTYFKDRKEFYSQAGVSFNNLEYKKRFGCTSSERERVKKEIICFVRKKIQNKEKVTRSEICKTFSIDWSLVPYFNSLKEIMVKANDC